MKKPGILLLILLLITGCTTVQEVEYSLVEGIVEVSYDELSELTDSNVKFLLYIGRPDCGDCMEFYPILEDYIEENEGTGIYYMNIKEMRDAAKSDDATEEEIEFYENFYEEYEVSWTPTLEIISNGKIVDSYQYLDEDYFDIEDRSEQKERRQEFIDEFYDFMDSYFEEVNNE